MNEYAIKHVTDSSYCFPSGEHTMVLRLRTAKDDIKEAVVIYECKYIFHECRKQQKMVKIGSDRLYDYFSATLTLRDSRLAYVFYVNDGENKYYFSEDGIISDYDFSLGYYNFFQYAYINRADVMECVDWMRSAVFYQIFVDRFCIGDVNKDFGYVNTKWGEIPTPNTFTGGDILGIINKLDYIKELGISAIYLTPVFQSVSNHKYDISDYYVIDRQFGTNEDLKKLVEEAHKRDMKVVLDAVFNHCSENLSMFQDVLKRGKESPYYDWFIIYGDKPIKDKRNYETFAFCDYMPKLDTSNEEVQDFLSGIALFYVKEYHIDGWRLDVSDEVSHDFWRKLRKDIKRENKDVVLIGENWHDAYSYLRGDQYDSIMNYAFTKACLDYYKNETMDAFQFAGKLNELLMRNSDMVNEMMLNLLDSHDTHRFFSEVGKDRRKMAAALCTMFFFPGTPCIYYGTEQLIEGGYDPDGRRCMNWNMEKTDMFYLIQKLCCIRTRMSHEKQETTISASQGVFMISRKSEDNEYILFVNNTCIDVRIEKQDVKAHSYDICRNGISIL